MNKQYRPLARAWDRNWCRMHRNTLKITRFHRFKHNWPRKWCGGENVGENIRTRSREYSGTPGPRLHPGVTSGCTCVVVSRNGGSGSNLCGR